MARDQLDRVRRVEQKKVLREKEQKDRQKIKDKEVVAGNNSGVHGIGGSARKS